MRSSGFNSNLILFIALMTLPFFGTAGQTANSLSKEIKFRIYTDSVQMRADTVLVKKQEQSKVDTSKKVSVTLNKTSVKGKGKSSPTKTFPITRSSIKQVPRSIPKLKPQPVNQSSSLPEILSKGERNIPF